jgi:hypothetical protein
MSRRKKKEEGNYSPDTPPERTFTAYIIKGNRQVVSRQVSASKRFRVDEDTYVIKENCIFLKMIDGRMQSVAYYREGNPNPYTFQDLNKGLTPIELDRMYADDFYHIITNMQITNRALYILIVVLINLCLCIAFDIGVLINAFG